jgi:hypothetical protein
LDRQRPPGVSLSVRSHASGPVRRTLQIPLAVLHVRSFLLSHRPA